MRDEFKSDKRITDVSGEALVGKVPLPNFRVDSSTVFIQFTDGTFVYGGTEAYEGGIYYDAEISIWEANRLGLLADDDPRYVAWKTEFDVLQAESQAERRERQVAYEASIEAQYRQLYGLPGVRAGRPKHVDCQSGIAASTVIDSSGHWKILRSWPLELTPEAAARLDAQLPKPNDTLLAAVQSKVNEDGSFTVRYGDY